MTMIDFSSTFTPIPWTYQPPGSRETLASVAESAFGKYERFYFVIPLNASLEPKPIPLSQYKIKLREQSPAVVTLLFSSRSSHQHPKLMIALPISRNHSSNLQMIKCIDQNRWIHPKRFMRLLKHLPTTLDWQRRIAGYCFRNFGPELLEWDELVKRINSLTETYPVDGSCKEISVFRAFKRVDRCNAFKQCDVTATIEGAAIYCFYAIRSYWTPNPEAALLLKTKYDQGYRHPTQLYCLAALNVADRPEQTRKFLRSYQHHASRHLDAERILRPITQQYKTAISCQLTPPSAPVILRAKSMLDVSELLMSCNRVSEAQCLRKKVREMTRDYLSENPNDPDALEVKAQMLRNSSLSQDKFLAEHYSRRANQIRSANSSPRQEVRTGESRRTF